MGEGGHSLSGPPSIDVPDLEVCRANEGHSSSETHRGSTERAGRFGLQGRPSSPGGMATDRSSLGVDSVEHPVSHTDSRSVRKPLEPSISKVRLSLRRSRSGDSGSHREPLASGGNLRLSPQLPGGSVPSSPTAGEVVSSGPSRILVPSGQVDAATSLSTGEGQFGLPGGSAPTVSATLGSHANTSIPRQPPPDLYSAEWLKSQGLSERVVARVLEARALSTRKHYKSQWDVFVTWCVSLQLDPLNASISLLNRFMDHLFNDRKVSVRTIKNYRSSIAFHWRTQTGFEIPEDDKIIKDLFRSFKRERPIPHKHVVTWDIGYVLSFFSSGRFKNWDQCSDKDLTLKCVFLLALATGKRRGELHALQHGVPWIKGNYRQVELIPSPNFISKTQLAADVGALRPFTVSSLDELAGPEGKEDKLLCPLRTLCFYLKRSDEYRSESQKKSSLFPIAGA